MYKEIDDLRILSKNGDNLAKQNLLQKLNPLIISSIKRYYNNYSQYEDLIQEGYEEILKCIVDYDENRGVNFLGYIKVKLKFLYLNKHKEKKTFSLNETLGEDGVELIELLEGEENPLEDYLMKESNESLIDALSKLTERQREVLILFYIDELSIGEISKKLGISYRTVVNTKTRALELCLKNCQW
ncbi:sigma-70 family RNA polymerase sigma factor [Anaerosalibacter sp. Marseille-P3206]|uniref:sigma-70 family RNA polymerase sigma factor n=1 Tax=Anaerosalibacter sp. Marseille-P3206 TaxID=1871005 RepID=UPI000986BD3C|nr:sigma-70 family RNA polymerase sigma factor [Anaerosalibacter sp. Marseille-P3206]